MGDACLKVLFISFNVICLMAGILMFAGGLLIQYLPVVQQTLLAVNGTVTQTQIGAIGVGLIALGALVLLISLVGCCGAISESRGLLGVYFVCLLLLLLGQIGIATAAFVYGYQGLTTQILDYMREIVHGYGTPRTGQKSMEAFDFVQQNFQCCGYNGTSDFINYKPSATTQSPAPTSNATTAQTMQTTGSPVTNMEMSSVANATETTGMTVIMTAGEVTTAATTTGGGMNQSMTQTTPTYLTGFWPESCCKQTGGKYINVTICTDNTQPLSVLEMYLNTQGCFPAVEKFVNDNLILIGAVTLGIAFAQLMAMTMACCIRKSID